MPNIINTQTQNITYAYVLVSADLAFVGICFMTSSLLLICTTSNIDSQSSLVISYTSIASMTDCTPFYKCRQIDRQIDQQRQTVIIGNVMWCEISSTVVGDDHIPLHP